MRGAARAFLLAAALLAAGAAMAASPLDGTWTTDPDLTALPRQPLVIQLRQGVFECRSCTPRLKARADGEDHPLVKHPAYDTVAVRVIDDRALHLLFKKQGQLLFHAKHTMSPDGKALLRESTRLYEDGTSGSSQWSYERVARAPRGAHRASGSWRAVKVRRETGAGRSLTIRTEPGRLHLHTPEGFAYTAPLDGTPVATRGALGIDKVAVTMPVRHRMVEVGYRRGKPHIRTTIEVARDGKTARLAWKNLESGNSGASVLVRR